VRDGSDHVLCLTTATITIPGDLDYDQDIDIIDFNLFCATYGSKMGDSNYNPMADYDHDCCITLVDYGIWMDYYQSYNG